MSHSLMYKENSILCFKMAAFCACWMSAVVKVLQFFHIFGVTQQTWEPEQRKQYYPN